MLPVACPAHKVAPALLGGRGMDLELEWNGAARSAVVSGGQASLGGGPGDTVLLEGAPPGLVTLERADPHWAVRTSEPVSFSGRPFPAHVSRVWSPGETLQVGLLQARWREAEGASTHSTAVLARRLLGTGQVAGGAASASLLCLCGKDLGRRWVLGRSGAVLGRSTQVQVRLLDESISRAHLAFTRGLEGWWVEDLGSPNGLRVDGKRWKRTVLVHGALLDLGRVHLRFEAPGSGAPAVPEFPVARDVANAPERLSAPALASPPESSWPCESGREDARWLRAVVGLAGAAALLGLGWT